MRVCVQISLRRQHTGLTCVSARPSDKLPHSEWAQVGTPQMSPGDAFGPSEAGSRNAWGDRVRPGAGRAWVPLA